MNYAIALVIGLLAGAHSATWGMYKDSPHEGFTYWKYSRSIIVSALVAIGVAYVTSLPMARASSMVIVYGVTYGIERALLEFYKTFLRDEDQSKYFIPMQFHILGRVVKSRWARLLAGSVYVVVVLLAGIGLYLLQRANLGIPGWLLVLLIGGVGGWISAFGGAWKDAPIEGFETLKFFRSPVIALTYAFLLASFTENLFYVAIGAVGYTVGTIETYKTFFFPNKPRGKFVGKPIKYPEMLERRKRFVPLYVAIWATVITTYVVAFTQPHTGLV